MQAFSFSGFEKSLTGASMLSLLWCGLLLIIFLGSSIGWLARGSKVGKTARADEEFTAAFRSSAHLLALFQTGMVFPGSARAAVYQNACRELSWHLLGTDTVDKNYMARLRTAGRITPSQADAVLRTSGHVTDEVTRPMLAGLDGIAVWSLPILGFVGALVCLLDGLGRGEVGVGLWSSVLWPLLAGALFFLFAVMGQRRFSRQARAAAAHVRDFGVEIGVALDRMFVDHREPMERLPSLGGMGLVEGPNFTQPPAETPGAPAVPASPRVVGTGS
ncbi:hypothetical protein [Roseimicrobium gellanilyticum]|nr:hypothetical protein [Roseimicrobium gellanilyticum]